MEEYNLYTSFAPFLGIFGIGIAFLIFLFIKRQPVGTEKMKEISDLIHEGAMVFLKREYSILFIFIALVFLLLLVFISIWTALAFITGASCSILAGFFGIKAATRANVRTSQAANQYGIGKALSISFLGGSVMGLSVASLGLIGVGLAFWGYQRGIIAASDINGFAMGASSIALFARVGGGIFTKTADIGADLVGKVEAGIPEDDPRNPGVIADNVGDCVGDTAGMGADIFESYVGSIVATIAIGATMVIPQGTLKINWMSLPLILVMSGLLSSLLGILSIKILERFSPAAALRYSTIFAAGIFLISSYYIIRFLNMKTAV
ncbi:MAG: sodium/proton-translocating pyrophosphatase, partial [Fidelibacterota bacterium]